MPLELDAIQSPGDVIGTAVGAWRRLSVRGTARPLVGLGSRWARRDAA